MGEGTAKIRNPALQGKAREVEGVTEVLVVVAEVLR